MKQNYYRNVASSFLILSVIFVSTSVMSAQTGGNHDAFVGVVERIDADARIVYVKSKDGVVKAFKWTRKTSVHGIKEAAIWSDHAAHTGAHVVIRSAKVVGEDTIRGIHWFGHGTAKVVEGTVRYVGKGSKKLAIKVGNEAEEVYDVSELAVVHTGKAVAHGARSVEKATLKGAKGTIHLVESGGKKFVHFFRHDS